MINPFKTASVTALVALACAFPSITKAELPDQTISDYKIGESVVGEKVGKKDLKGRVVVIEYWGTR